MAKYQEWLTDDKLILIQAWARDGLTDEQIAHNMGIAYSTFKEWKKKYTAFSAILKKGKEVADYEVENALYKSAMGYDKEECTFERRFNKKTGEYEMICTKKVVKHIPPSNTAQIFWLKNRKPDVWRDKQGDESNTEAKQFMAVQLQALREAADNDTAIKDAE